jgi:hypothetical protein
VSAGRRTWPQSRGTHQRVRLRRRGPIWLTGRSQSIIPINRPTPVYAVVRPKSHGGSNCVGGVNAETPGFRADEQCPSPRPNYFNRRPVFRSRRRRPSHSVLRAKRGPLFDAKIADRIVVRRNAQPLLDACRVLMAEGCNPATPIVMQHEGSVMDALRTTVGHAGKLTVDEPTDGKRPPRFRDWRPRDMGDDSSPPIAPGDLEAAE